MTDASWPALARALPLFVATAVAEVAGCFAVHLWLRKGAPPWVLLPGAASLAAFAWLLTLHPTAAGRTYAAYGGVYIVTALAWLSLVERQRPTALDLAGAALCLCGAAVLVSAPRP